MDEKKDEKKFAQGKCFFKFFWVFVIGSVLGCYWEELLDLTCNLLETGRFSFKFERGLVIGPFSPVYGFSAMLITLLFADRKFKWWQYLLYGALAGGAFEYFLSFVQEKFTGTVSWDYSDIPLNINGRTNIPYMFFWGLIVLIWSVYVYPKISKIIEGLPYKSATIFTILLVIFIAFDLVLSWSASFRQVSRKKGIPPRNILEEYFDKKYNDDFFNKYYEVIDIN